MIDFSVDLNALQDELILRAQRGKARVQAAERQGGLEIRAAAGRLRWRAVQVDGSVARRFMHLKQLALPTARAGHVQRLE